MGKYSQILVTWDFKGKPHFEAENLDYDAEISFKNLKTTAGIELKLTRKFTRCLVEIILPTALLVLVCSVSFNLVMLLRLWVYAFIECFKTG